MSGGAITLKVIEEIVNCKGYDSCFGKACGIDPKVVYDENIDYQGCKILVITEQPLKNENLINFVKQKNFKKGSTPDIINKYLNYRFYDGIISGKIYWTHFIKCPGNLRKDKKIKFNKKACAEKFIFKEIYEFKPELIITFGNEPKSLFVQHNIGMQINRIYGIYLKNKNLNKIFNILPKFKDSSILTLYHPSRRSPKSIKNEKIKEVVNKILDKILKET